MRKMQYSKFNVLCPVTIHLFCLLLFTLLFRTQAGLAAPKSLDECIGLALENNFQIRQLNERMIQVQLDYVKAKAGYRPKLDLRMDVPTYSEGRTETIPTGFKTPLLSTDTQLKYNLGLTLSQPLPTDGRISVATNLYNQKNLSDFYADREDNSSDVTVTIEQPLFTDNLLQESLFKGELNLKSAEASYKRQRTATVLSITQTYMNLVKSIRRAKIDSESVEKSRMMKDLAERKFNAGLIPEVESIRLEVDLITREATLSSSLANVKKSEDDLKAAMGVSLDDSLQIVTEIEYTPVVLNFADLLREGMKNRSELKEADIEIELAKLSIRSAERSNEFKGSLKGSYGWNYRKRQILNEKSNLDLNNWAASLTFTLPILDGSLNEANVRTAKSSLRTSELRRQDTERSLILDIKNSFRQLQEVENRLKILQRQVELARKSYDITQQRFEQGIITSQQLLDAQLALTNANVDNLNALVDYSLALASLEKATMMKLSGENSKQ